MGSLEGGTGDRGTQYRVCRLGFRVQGIQSLEFP